MPTGTKSINTIESVLNHLGEAHEVSVYEAIERLMLAGEATGFDADALLRMRDRGMTFEQLLEVIESKMQSLQMAA